MDEKLKTTQEAIAKTSKRAMQILDSKVEELHMTTLGHSELQAVAAVEQVRATYVLATVLGDILDEIHQIRYDLPMAGRGTRMSRLFLVKKQDPEEVRCVGVLLKRCKKKCSECWFATERGEPTMVSVRVFMRIQESVKE